ncbi:hypothetical protein FKX85_06440 [Echinicola soli]|uniref:Uncharacterized protein n=1 Tax=Echinicola soli TaxID=2591634 RepID=A0A514CFV7_9BACT|nr:hypothetical protein [Echinicola soli]QDH78692.1 hypothetical protein FKX85_06440 [Echinicola soli]
MKKEIDRLNQHIFVPLLLALASITLIMALYFCSEWLISSEVPRDVSFFTYQGDVSSQAYHAEMGWFMALFFILAAICIGAALAKHRLASLVALALGTVGVLYLVF